MWAMVFDLSKVKSLYGILGVSIKRSNSRLIAVGDDWNLIDISPVVVEVNMLNKSEGD